MKQEIHFMDLPRSRLEQFAGQKLQKGHFMQKMSNLLNSITILGITIRNLFKYSNRPDISLKVFCEHFLKSKNLRGK